MYHAGGRLPSPHDIAHALPGGIVRADGHIDFEDPFNPKRGKRPCGLWLRPDLPDGFTVEHAGKKYDPIELKDRVRELVPAIGPFTPRSKNSANGKAHRPAAGPVVREPVQRNGRKGGGGAEPRPLQPQPKRIHLVPLDQIKLGRKRRDLIKGLIPRVGMALLYGAPKSGKSFLAFDIAMHVAMGLEYRGRRTQPGAAVYCYFEGQTLASARVEAFRQRRMAESAEGVPFFLMPATINLVAEQQDLIAAIRDTLGETNPAIVVLDTLNRSFVGSESSDQDMTAYVKAADAIREAFECAILIVHHCGHDATRPRGHTALIGAADAVIGVKKESAGQFIATVEMMKDGPSGQMIAGRLEEVELGDDEDGNPITSCVIAPVELAPRTAETKTIKLTRNEQLALKALQYAIGEVGQAPPPCKHIPQDPNVRVVSRDQWRDYAWRHGISGSDDERAKRQAFQRAVEGLLSKGRVGYLEPLAWQI